MTPTVHATANFMHWHRYYIWTYETALGTECDYKGYHSPIFNGDEWSMGDNGGPIGSHAGMNLGPGATLPGGPGGGCISQGPFANLTIYLGPLAPTIDPELNIKPNPRADGFGNNTRCHRRDLSNFFTELPTALRSLNPHHQ
ncbi:tyrosinase [Alternaria panax]|uniref:Tyrosinase n=1 Tax=Alternaria panax TaxID=48097 RepID=A0AAD4FI90_9PLEO|nr:tyrosinase [Alternaria panax]